MWKILNFYIFPTIAKMKEFLREYFQQPEGLPWMFAAIVCAVWVLVGIIVWGYRKYSNRNNKVSFPKCLWYRDVVDINEDGEDREYDSHMIEYLSYYSFVMLITSWLEYIIEGEVGRLTRLEMWGVVNALIGLIVCSSAIFLVLKARTILCNWSVNKNWGFFEPIIPLVYARIVLWGRIGAIIWMLIGYIRITSWIGLDGWAVIIAGIIPALFMLYEIIAVFIRKYKNLFFKD